MSNGSEECVSINRLIHNVQQLTPRPASVYQDSSPKGFVTSCFSTASWVSGVHTHEPIMNISDSNCSRHRMKAYTKMSTFSDFKSRGITVVVSSELK